MPKCAHCDQIFDEAKKQATGYACYNRFFGGYELKAVPLRFGPMGATKRACPDLEEAVETEFLKVLDATRRWRIVDETLELLNRESQACRACLRTTSIILTAWALFFVIGPLLARIARSPLRCFMVPCPLKVIFTLPHIGSTGFLLSPLGCSWPPEVSACRVWFSKWGFSAPLQLSDSCRIRHFAYRLEMAGKNRSVSSSSPLC